MARRYFGQMVSAMDHCHARSVFHRDLKPENILLGGTSLDEIKIADFGLAALLSQVDHGDGGHFLNHTKCGSIMYAAPELLLSTERVGYDSATADIWSLGVILYSMLAGALPFKVALAARCPRFAWVEQHGLGPICAHLGLSPEASEVLQAMLRPVSSERPSLAQILECAWLQPIAHELPQRQAPGTPSRRAAAAPPTPKAAASPGMFGKWCGAPANRGAGLSLGHQRLAPTPTPTPPHPHPHPLNHPRAPERPSPSPSLDPHPSPSRCP